MKTPLQDAVWYKARLASNRKVRDLDDESRESLKTDYEPIKAQAKQIVAAAVRKGYIRFTQ